jgi:hypothetical protein
VDVHGGVEGAEFAGVHGEVRGGEVAEVDCEGAVAGELVGGGAADAEGGVCAGYYYYFGLGSSEWVRALGYVQMFVEGGGMEGRSGGW